MPLSQPNFLDNTCRHVSHTRITSDLSRMNVRPVLNLIKSISHKRCPDLPSGWPKLLCNTWTKIEGLSPVSLDQLGYLGVMIPAFLEQWNNNTLGTGWAGSKWATRRREVYVCVWEGGQTAHLVLTQTKPTAEAYIVKTNCLQNNFSCKIMYFFGQSNVGATSCP